MCLKWWQTVLHNFCVKSCFYPTISSNTIIPHRLNNFIMYVYDLFDALHTIWEKRLKLILIKSIIAGASKQKKWSWVLRLIVFVKYKDVSIKLNPKINRRSIFRWQFLYNKHFSFRSFQFSTIINLRKAALRTTRKVLNEWGENLI